LRIDTGVNLRRKRVLTVPFALEPIMVTWFDVSRVPEEARALCLVKLGGRIPTYRLSRVYGGETQRF